MSKYRLNHEIVVEGAAELVNQRGADALSLAELAARFRVRTPSLYNHVQGLDGLRRDLALYGLTDLTERVQAAGTGLAGKDALAAIADAYRVYARQNPGVYSFTLRSVEGEDEELRAAGEALLNLLLAALRGYKLEGDQAIHAARAVRSALHGFASLEAAGGFGIPVNLDDSYVRMVDVLDAGLRAKS
jgi:AcrR family transcriptional regulator